MTLVTFLKIFVVNSRSFTLRFILDILNCLFLYLSQVRPGDVASQESVRKALGIGTVSDNPSEQGKRQQNTETNSFGRRFQFLHLFL